MIGKCDKCICSDWTSIYTLMPTIGKDVLVCTKNSKIIPAFWDYCSSDEGDWYDIENEWIIEDVTHWMNLPKPPKEK